MSNYIRAIEEDFGENTEVIREKHEPIIELLPDEIGDDVGFRLRFKDGAGQAIIKPYLNSNPKLMLSAIFLWIKERKDWLKEK